ncbi:MAG: MBL fold metallo-hydrolase [Pseudomonadota bacterium]
MTLKLTILGCGSSTGVPRIGGDWGACDPNNPKNYRRRCSLLVEQEAPEGITRVIIDTSPDIRQQLLDTNVDWLDGVLYTHDHADHTHGIDDLRMLVMNKKRRVDVYANTETLGVLQKRFDYCFTSPEGSVYPPILNANLVHPGQPVSISGPGGDIEVLPFLQHHGRIACLGFRFGNVAYSCDLHDLPEETLSHLQNLDVWIVDALRRKPHPTHFNLETTLSWIERVQPKKAILTDMHVDMDYQTLCEELPKHIRPAYDGLVIIDGEVLTY